MKAIPWLLAGIGAGIAVYVLINQPGPQYATGSDNVEDAASKTALWGSKQRISGAGVGIAGKLKKGLGDVIGDDELAGEGVADQIAGGVKDIAGKVAQAAGETIHELNR